MRNRKINNEQGQAMVLLVLVIIGLLGALALAVDGGMILYDRRSAQNAADAAAMAGGYELARDPWTTATLSSRIQSAGLTRAADNGYSAPGKVVTVEYPPTDDGTFHYVSGDTVDNIKNYVRVTITSPVNTAFMHFVYAGPVQNQVVSVVHVIPPAKGPAFSGSGLVVLAPTGCSTLYAGGNVNANLIGGGIFVNSNSNSTSPACTAMNVQGGSNFVYSPSVTVVGGLSDAGGLIVQPGPISFFPTPIPAISYPPTTGVPDTPSCSKAATIALKNQWIDNDTGKSYSTDPGLQINSTSYTHEMSPGTDGTGYYNSALNENIWFMPGIYCFSSGFNINNNQHIGGDGVLFYITIPDPPGHPVPEPCNITWNGGATIRLSSYQSGTYKGVLMFIDPRNYSALSAGPLTFAGNTNSYIKGTIYAPTCSVKMNGTGGNFYQGQMIGYDITLLGGAAINLQYVAGDNYEPQTPSQVDLTQ